MAETTTISIDPKVKAMLDDLKIYSEESYNSIIERLANMAYDPEPLSEDEIKGIEKSLRELKEGTVLTAEEVCKGLE